MEIDKTRYTEDDIVFIPVGKAKDLTGQKFGRLTVLGRAPFDGVSKGARWWCRCECGNITKSAGPGLQNGTTKSCGCYNKELVREACREIGKKSYFKDYSSEKLNNNPYYEFIEPTSKRDKDGTVYWKIKCRNCGAIYEEIPCFLLSDKRRKGNNPCKCYQR